MAPVKGCTRKQSVLGVLEMSAEVADVDLC